MTKRRYYRRVQSPLETTTPNGFTTPHRNPYTGLYEIRCPNGEVLTNASREAAWQTFFKLKKGI